MEADAELMEVVIKIMVTLIMITCKENSVKVNGEVMMNYDS